MLVADFSAFLRETCCGCLQQSNPDNPPVKSTTAKKTVGVTRDKVEKSAKAAVTTNAAKQPDVKVIPVPRKHGLASVVILQDPQTPSEQRDPAKKNRTTFAKATRLSPVKCFRPTVTICTPPHNGATTTGPTWQRQTAYSNSSTVREKLRELTIQFWDTTKVGLRCCAAYDNNIGEAFACALNIDSSLNVTITRLGTILSPTEIIVYRFRLCDAKTVLEGPMLMHGSPRTPEETGPDTGVTTVVSSESRPGGSLGSGRGGENGGSEGSDKSDRGRNDLELLERCVQVLLGPKAREPSNAFPEQKVLPSSIILLFGSNEEREHAFAALSILKIMARKAEERRELRKSKVPISSKRRTTNNTS